MPVPFFSALQSPVFQLEQLISVGTTRVGMVYTALCPDQPFTARDPFPYPSGSYVLLHNGTKHANAPHIIWCSVG